MENNTTGPVTPDAESCSFLCVAKVSLLLGAYMFTDNVSTAFICFFLVYLDVISLCGKNKYIATIGFAFLREEKERRNLSL